MVAMLASAAVTTLGSDYYPQDALERGEEGVVAVRFEVSATGLPGRCWVVRSSHFTSLDNASCPTVARMTFDPARQADGAAVLGTLTKRIRWQIVANEEQTKERSDTERDVAATSGWFLLIASQFYYLRRRFRQPERGATASVDGSVAAKRTFDADAVIQAGLLSATLLVLAILLQ